MTGPVFYVDRSEIRPGSFAHVKTLMKELAEFVRAKEPRLISYNFFADAAENHMTVIAVHPDSASMELHLEIGNPKFREFAGHIDLLTVDVYGDVSEKVLAQLRAKAKMLGAGAVTQHKLEAGFSRLAEA